MLNCLKTQRGLRIENRKLIGLAQRRASTQIIVILAGLYRLRNTSYSHIEIPKCMA